jgi:hypothetical protein
MSTDTLLIDTGSSNTWLGASQAYSKTSTSKSTGKNVSATYGSGSFNGTECEQISILNYFQLHQFAPRDPDIDTVTLSPGLVITSQSIGVASSSRGFQDVDGILGFMSLVCLSASSH